MISAVFPREERSMIIGYARVSTLRPRTSASNSTTLKPPEPPRYSKKRSAAPKPTGPNSPSS